MADYAKLSASELYLLDKWDSTLQEDPVVQRDQLFRTYVDTGSAGRWPYHVASRSGNYQSPTELQIRTILQPTRTVRQREVASVLTSDQGEPHKTWLRTYYGAGRNPSEIVPIREVCSTTGNECSDILVLSDNKLYNYGSNWSEILTSIPEVLDSYLGPRDPEQLWKDISDAKEEAAPAMEFSGEDWQEDLRASVHHEYVTGVLWVQDEETSRSGELLLLWIDEYGNIVRQNRVEANHVDLYSGMFLKYADDESEWWRLADTGEVYAHGNWPDCSGSRLSVTDNAQGA